MKLLVVEDDLELRGVLSRGLREEGFDVHTVGTGGEVLPRVASDPPDVLIVDIGLPRPRNSEIVSSTAFGHHVAEIWNDLREEASRGMRDEETHARDRATR